jgi:hypothetical protein
MQAEPEVKDMAVSEPTSPNKRKRKAEATLESMVAGPDSAEKKMTPGRPQFALEEMRQMIDGSGRYVLKERKAKRKQPLDVYGMRTFVSSARKHRGFSEEIFGDERELKVVVEGTGEEFTLPIHGRSVARNAAIAKVNASRILKSLTKYGGTNLGAKSQTRLGAILRDFGYGAKMSAKAREYLEQSEAAALEEHEDHDARETQEDEEEEEGETMEEAVETAGEAADNEPMTE